jgi:hypothetical protein
MLVVEEEIYDMSQWGGYYAAEDMYDDSYYTFNCPHCGYSVLQIDGPNSSGGSTCRNCGRVLKHMGQLFYGHRDRIRFHHGDIESLVPVKAEEGF